MTKKAITPKQRESLLKFFNTPFEKTKMHKCLIGFMALLILSLIGTFFFTVWGSISLGIKMLVSEIGLFFITMVAHSIIEESYKRLWSSYIREYPEVWKEFENSLIQKVKDNKEKQLDKLKQRMIEGLEAIKSEKN